MACRGGVVFIVADGAVWRADNGGTRSVSSEAEVGVPERFEVALVFAWPDAISRIQRDGLPHVFLIVIRHVKQGYLREIIQIMTNHIINV